MAGAAAETVDVDLNPRAANTARRAARLVALAMCCLLISEHAGYGQDAEPGQWFTRVGFAPAFVVSTNPFASRDADPSQKPVSAAPSLTLEIGRQTDGSRAWHQMYGLPSYGFGVSIASLGNETSRPVDMYTFFSWPFARPSERLEVTTDFGMGLSWNWKALDRQTNAYATVLGSNLNARIDWGFYLRYIATEQVSLYTGADFTHRSNGGMHQPDQGINVIGPSVGVRYNLGAEHQRLPLKTPPPFRPAWEFVVGAAGGLKNVFDQSHPDLRRNFGAFDATTGLERHFYRYGKISAGTNLTYDGATGAHFDSYHGALVPRGNIGDRLAAGIYGGYEHVIGRFGAIVQVGYNVANGSDDSRPPRLYQRYGWRYNFNDHYWGTFSVRTIKNRKADFLGFGFGYRVRWQ